MKTKNVLKTTALHNRGIGLDFTVYEADSDFIRTKLMAKSTSLKHAINLIYADFVFYYDLNIHHSEFSKYMSSKCYGDYMEIECVAPCSGYGFVCEHYLIHHETSN